MGGHDPLIRELPEELGVVDQRTAGVPVPLEDPCPRGEVLREPLPMRRWAVLVVGRVPDQEAGSSAAAKYPATTVRASARVLPVTEYSTMRPSSTRTERVPFAPMAAGSIAPSATVPCDVIRPTGR